MNNIMTIRRAQIANAETVEEVTLSREESFYSIVEPLKVFSLPFFYDMQFTKHAIHVVAHTIVGGVGQ